MLRSLLFTLFLASSTGLFACDCLYVDNFCDYLEGYLERDSSNGEIVVAEVTLLRQYPSPSESQLYGFSIDNVLAGEYSEEQVLLLGGDVFTCFGPYEPFAPGRRFVLIFDKGDYLGDYVRTSSRGPYPIYDFPGCGVSYLDVDDKSVTGSITGPPERMTKEEFRQQLVICGGEGLVQAFPTDPSANLPAVSVNVYPNPTTGPLTVVVESDSRVERVDVADIRGRGIVSNLGVAPAGGSELPRVYTFDLSGLAGGVYYLTVRTSGRTVRRKVVVI